MLGLTTDDFIKKAIFVHGNQYTYDNAVFVNSSTYVNVTCKVHGDFPVRPYNHIYGRTGCPKCNKYHKKTRDEFIERAIKKHDKIKDEYCATRGIRLLRIPYYDKYKLDEILAREVLTWVQE